MLHKSHLYSVYVVTILLRSFQQFLKTTVNLPRTVLQLSQKGNGRGIYEKGFKNSRRGVYRGRSPFTEQEKEKRKEGRMENYSEPHTVHNLSGKTAVLQTLQAAHVKTKYVSHLKTYKRSNLKHNGLWSFFRRHSSELYWNIVYNKYWWQDRHHFCWKTWRKSMNENYLTKAYKRSKRHFIHSKVCRVQCPSPSSVQGQGPAQSIPLVPFCSSFQGSRCNKNS